MKDETKGRRGRATTLSVAAMAAALAAFIVLAPFASGAADPVATGTTKITLNTGLFKKLKKEKVKLSAVKPGKVKGKSITLPIVASTSTMDPTTGAGTLNHSGGFKFKAGKKKVVIKSLVLDTVKKGLFGKVGKKKMKIAAVAGVSIAREGFGLGIVGKKLKLAKKAAKTLNKQLEVDVFKPNKSLGAATSSEQPETVTITGGSATLTTDLGTVTKLFKDNVKIELIAPTNEASKGPPPAYSFPISGGSIAPDASKGIVQTNGGLKLVQAWPAACTGGEAKATTMTLNAIWVDLGTKVATVEVTVESTLSSEANLGNLGRSSIADVSLTGAAVGSDPQSHTVTVQNASSALQAVTAETLNSLFYNAAKKFKEGGCPVPGLDPQSFAAGDGLGSFSMTANTQ